MAEIRVLVLGNNAFAHKLDIDLKAEGIKCTIDEEAAPDAVYDLYICNPEMNLLNKISSSKTCGSRILVFNGMKMSNATLKNLVRLRINGFLEDHNNTTPAVEFLKSIAKTKDTCTRLSSKIATLCSA